LSNTIEPSPESERCRHEWRSPHAVDGLRYVDRYFQPPQDAPVWCPSCGSVKVDTRIFSPVVHNERAGLEAERADRTVRLLGETLRERLTAAEQALTAANKRADQLQREKTELLNLGAQYAIDHRRELQAEREKAALAEEMADWLRRNHDDCDDECEVWPMIDRYDALVAPMTEAK
jgi:hypothetical protein